ncbi:MAG: c-type cytochrome [Limisphaerales bacterium]
MNEKTSLPLERTDFSIPSENPEPKAGVIAVPVLLFALLAILFYSGQLYVDKNGGEFSAKVYAPYESEAQLEKVHPNTGPGALAAKGKMLYSNYCQVCHQANGLGTPGQFPPLAGSEWVLAAGPNRIIRIVLRGLQGPIKIKGQDFVSSAAMPLWRDLLKDEDIAAVLTYIRSDWGNKAKAVKPEQVKAVRDATKDQSDPMTADELSKISDSEK